MMLFNRHIDNICEALVLFKLHRFYSEGIGIEHYSRSIGSALEYPRSTGVIDDNSRGMIWDYIFFFILDIWDYTRELDIIPDCWRCIGISLHSKSIEINKIVQEEWVLLEILNIIIEIVIKGFIQKGIHGFFSWYKLYNL